jgi:hypothetical protein
MLETPFLSERPVLDGATSEWPENWIDLKYIAELSYTNECAARFNLGWTKDTLYLAYKVNDNSPYNYHDNDKPYLNDCVSILISMDSSRIWFEISFPNLIIQRTNAVVVVSQKKIALNARAYTKNTMENYTIELAIPFCNITDYKSTPKNGDVIAFNTSVSDNTGPKPESSGQSQLLFWNKSGESSIGTVYCGYLGLNGNDPSSIAGTVLAKNNMLTIRNNEAILDKAYPSVAVFDITGKLLIRESNTDRISLNGMPAGLYILNNNRQSFKIVKR